MFSWYRNAYKCSEREIDRYLYFRFLIFRLLSNLMNRDPINKNGLVGSCGAGIFTMAAANADIGVCFRYNKVAFVGDHIYCFCRTCFRAGSTGCFFCFYYTVILNEICLADPGKLLGFNNKRLKGIGRAYLCANSTIIGTEALMVIHYRLHHAFHAVLQQGWLKNIVWAGCYTQRTGSAISVEILY